MIVPREVSTLKEAECAPGVVGCSCYHCSEAVFFREKTGECRAYSYNNSTRIVSALRKGSWMPIGEVYDDMGYIRLYEGKDWLP